MVTEPSDAGAVRRLVEELRQRAEALRARPVAELCTVLGRVGARFLDDDDPVRRRALAELPGEARLSAEMARAVLDGMARDWTEDRLSALVSAELGDPACLDGPMEVTCSLPPPRGRVGRPSAPPASAAAGGRTLMAVGPASCVQIVSGSVPGVGVSALLRSLLVKAPTLLKPGRGDALLPDLFARALRDEDPVLADSLAVVYWPGGSVELESAALEGAELAVVYGSDRTVEALRSAAPATTRVVAYHHRVGVGIVGRGALAEGEAMRTAAEVARAAALFEGRGCVCPRLVYVEEGGETHPAGFAELLGEALGALEAELPAPLPGLEDAGSLAQLRGTVEIQAAAGSIELHHGGAEAVWTVVFEGEPVSVPGGGGRSVRVRPIDDAGRLAEELAPLGAHLQSVGYAGLGDRALSVAESLGRAGASRVTPFRALPFPPPWWLHDGRGPLRDLVRWMELEPE